MTSRDAFPLRWKCMPVFPKSLYLTAKINVNVFDDIGTYECIQNRPHDALKKTENVLSVTKLMQETAYSETTKLFNTKISNSCKTDSKINRRKHRTKPEWQMRPLQLNIPLFLCPSLELLPTGIWTHSSSQRHLFPQIKTLQSTLLYLWKSRTLYFFGG